MNNLKTIVFGFHCGGSSFTYEIILDFVKKIDSKIIGMHDDKNYRIEEIQKILEKQSKYEIK